MVALLWRGLVIQWRVVESLVCLDYLRAACVCDPGSLVGRESKRAWPFVEPFLWGGYLPSLPSRYLGGRILMFNLDVVRIVA
jgi:hypothetical protein